MCEPLEGCCFSFEEPLRKVVQEWVSSSKASAELIAAKSGALALLMGEFEDHARRCILPTAEDLSSPLVEKRASQLCHNGCSILMSICRLLACDERELWPLLDAPVAMARRVSEMLTCWNEQQAVKVGLSLDTAVHRKVIASGRSNDVQKNEDNDAGKDTTGLRSFLITITKQNIQGGAAAAAAPLHGSSVGEARSETTTDDHNKTPDEVYDYLLGNASRVAIVAMKYVVAANGSEDEDQEGEENNQCSASTDSGAVGVVTATAVSAEGSLQCVAPLPAFTPLITIDRRHMFMVSSLRGRCAFYDALAADSMLLSVFPDESTILLLSLVFEQFCIGAEASEWRRLLEGIPRCYPSVPTYWSLHELSELEGGTLIDDVLAKQEGLSTFHEQVMTALERSGGGLIDAIAQRLAMLVSGGSLSGGGGGGGGGDQFRETWRDVFSLDHLHWARATFDSRAFNLNVDGEVVLALVPIADMVNHSGSRSDILKRHVEPNGGPFVMTLGAPLTSADVGRELVMSYGPLQSWELVMSYGFIMETESNEHDRIPFPVLLHSRNGDDDDADDVDGEYRKRRWQLLDKHHLTISTDAWIGLSGVPCPALLAMLRIQLAQVEHFPVLESRSSDEFFAPVDNALERAVVESIRDTIIALSDDFSSSLEDDEALLAGTSSSSSAAAAETSDGGSQGEEEEDEEESTSASAAPLSPNARIAVVLRCIMKRILRGSLVWCEETLSSTLAES